MKHILSTALALAISLGAWGSKAKKAELSFDNNGGQPLTIAMADGSEINCTAYEHLYYVANVEDTAYQYLNIYVPEGANRRSPIFLRTYVGGYMAAKAARPQANDATGRALREGYVVVIPGSRGRNATVTKGKKETYTGRAPKALLDLKAAIRYLRHFDKEIPGNKERIVTDGTSAGGAMSALMGATGNHPDYEQMLGEMGAAPERDDVYASVCYCPITDLEHADMAYEWLYGQTDSRLSLDEAHSLLSRQLADDYANYVDALNLRKPDGTPLNAANYRDYLKQLIMASAQRAKNAGADIADTLGFLFSQGANGMFAAPINGGQVETKHRKLNAGGQWKPRNGMTMADAPTFIRGNRHEQGDAILGINLDTYLNYVVTTQPLKGVPAFDSYSQRLGNAASGENEEFGNESGNAVNFTSFMADYNGEKLTDTVKKNVRLMNPMNFIGDPQSTVAPHWYIRHGARDRDTAFPVPVNLALKLQNEGKNVNFLLAWNRPHSGDYALDELFEWLRHIVM